MSKRKSEQGELFETGSKRINEDKKELYDTEGKSRGFYSERNRLNDLTGREWVYWSKSVITQPYPPNIQHKLRNRHGGQKPPELCADLIRIFTKKGEMVLDPFAGVGGVLLGASLAGRRAVGIELEAEWTGIYTEVCRLEEIEVQEMITADSREELPRMAEKGWEADFILTDVPYWRMDKVQKSKGSFKRVGEEGRQNRKSKLNSFGSVQYESKTSWLSAMEEVFTLAMGILKKNKYLGVFIGDMYWNGRYHFLTADMAQMLSDLDLTMKAHLIWYDVSKSLHVYGYLYDFIPSLIHQNILIFKYES